ncbi:hydrogenase subunit [Methanospirillum lacunae]|uniref:Hydrogenase subunit n=1 Tax=Methanospirillum lacunae TaxID=668570 RepID=A0A2V2N4F7_9EURY|nr:hydrogenase subunit [Methanospirillum lacunae]PWR71388.1 hydrogenase subunit [Methanospirillum lacunae]
MIEPGMVSTLLRICLILVLISAACLLTTRNLSSLVRTYALQSLILVAIAILIGVIENNSILLLIAGITLVSKVIGIPWFIRIIQQRIKIQQDLKFSYLQPGGALMVSMLLILLVYLCFSRVLKDLFTENSLFFMGSVIGVSLMMMGLIAIFTRQLAITKVIGYLSMENGVLLFGLFVTELPFITEFVIMVDLIILVLLTTILTVGMDSSIDAYTNRLKEFHLWSEEEVQA